MPAVGLTPSGAVVAEDVRDLQTWPSHRRRRYGAGGSSGAFVSHACGAARSSRSSGLSILAISPVATRV